MAGRTRDVTPGYFCNENWPSPHEQILFLGLIVHADRDGRLEDRPRKLKVWCLPHWECDLDELLWSLCGEFIVRYENCEKKYIQVLNFLKYQKHIHPREAESEIPPIDADESHVRVVPRTYLGMSKDSPRSTLLVHPQGQVQEDQEDQEDQDQENPKAKTVPKPKPAIATKSRPKVTVDDLRFESLMDTPECRLAVDEWLDYKRSRGEGYRTPNHLSHLIASYSRAGPEALIAAIRFSMGCTYAGIVRDRNNAIPTTMQRKQAENAAVIERMRQRMNQVQPPDASQIAQDATGSPQTRKRQHSTTRPLPLSGDDAGPSAVD